VNCAPGILCSVTIKTWPSQQLYLTCTTNSLGWKRLHRIRILNPDEHSCEWNRRGSARACWTETSHFCTIPLVVSENQKPGFWPSEFSDDQVASSHPIYVAPWKRYQFNPYSYLINVETELLQLLIQDLLRLHTASRCFDLVVKNPCFPQPCPQLYWYRTLLHSLFKAIQWPSSAPLQTFSSPSRFQLELPVPSVTTPYRFCSLKCSRGLQIWRPQGPNEEWGYVSNSTCLVNWTLDSESYLEKANDIGVSILFDTSIAVINHKATPAVPSEQKTLLCYVNYSLIAPESTPCWSLKGQCTKGWYLLAVESQKKGDKRKWCTQVSTLTSFDESRTLSPT